LGFRCGQLLRARAGGSQVVLGLRIGQICLGPVHLPRERYAIGCILRRLRKGIVSLLGRFQRHAGAVHDTLRHGQLLGRRSSPKQRDIRFRRAHLGFGGGLRGLHRREGGFGLRALGRKQSGIELHQYVAGRDRLALCRVYSRYPPAQLWANVDGNRLDRAGGAQRAAIGRRGLIVVVPPAADDHDQQQDNRNDAPGIWMHDDL
jgi:hypothetical protein